MRQVYCTAFILLVALSGMTRPAAVQAQVDSAAMRRELRSTAREYERSMRRFAPHRVGSSPSHCDEIVGRFCLFYDAGPGPPLPPEPEGVKRAREGALRAFTAAFEAWPADTLVAAPLVRFLVEGERGSEAAQVARRFARASTHTSWPSLLLGFALHAEGSTNDAERAFDRALSDMSSSEREQWQDVRFLLAPGEKKRYRELAVDQRAGYERHLWRSADPLYLTSGNESRAEHMARLVYARILSRAPVVMGSSSWAADLDELTQRFGVPKARTQEFGRGTQPGITEHYDPDQLTYVPPELSGNGAVSLFEPGGAWPYDTIRARSGYAPSTVRRMRVLEHQLSRFPIDDSVVLRADWLLPLDSAAQLPARIEVGLFVLDSALQILRQVRDTITAERDTAYGFISLAMPDSALVYSLEARDIGSRLSARARYLLPLPLVSRPVISDVVMLQAGEAAPPSSRSSPAFLPLGSLRIRQEQPVVLYLEARGLTPNSDSEVHYRVDLEVFEQKQTAGLTRMVQKLGRVFGLGGGDVAPRITWTEQAAAAAMVPIALRVGRLDFAPGLKRFRFTVTDIESGLSSMVERVVRIEPAR